METVFQELIQEIHRLICYIMTFLALAFPSIFGGHSCDVCKACEHTGGTVSCVQLAVCELCGEEYGELAAHIPGDERKENEVEATCDRDGSYDTVTYCVTCDGVINRKTTKVQKKGHSWIEDASEEPNCTQDGYVTRVCEICGTGVTEVDKGSALGHAFGDWETVISPTCEADGSEKRICYRCDAEEIKVIPATGHDMQKTADQIDATCEADGKTAVYTCANGCGKTEGGEEISATGHTLGDYIVDEKATCTEAGSKHKECANCDYETVAEELSALGHAEESHEAKAPTCTEKGWDAYVTCSRCDYTTKVEKDALGHTSSEAVTEKEVAATCTVDGSYDSVVYCSVCNAELSRETKTVSATGHTEETIPAVAATCENTGLTAGVKCSVCDEILTAQTTVEELGHDYEGVVTTASTCTAKGEKT